MTPDDAAREGLSTSPAAYGARAAEYTELLGTMDAVAEDDRLLVEAWADRVDGVLADVGCGPADELSRLLIAAGFTVLDCGTRQDTGARLHGWIEAVRD